MTEKHFKDFDDYGTSIMLINSDKGFNIFNRIKGNFEIITVTQEEAKQPQLQYPPGKPNEKDRNHFFKLLDKYPYTLAINKFEKKKRRHSVNIFEKLINRKVVS